MTNFDSDAFLDWLDEHEQHPSSEELEEQWPDFPFHKLNGCTGPIIDGKLCHYTWDLQKIAKHQPILD